MEENKRISDLFERARNEAPKTSFNETKKHILAAGAVGGVGIIAKWTAASFKLKAIIMITLFSTLTITGILASMQIYPTSESVVVKADKKEKTEIEYIEISNEGGIQKTVIYNDNDQVLEVLIDTINEVESDVKIELSTNTPEIIHDHVNVGKSLVELKNDVPKFLISSDSLNKKEFTVTEKTTDEELENIAKQARAAGIIFSFSTRIRKSHIRKLKLEMKIESPEDCTDRRCSISGNTFSHKFGWWENDKGEAVSLLKIHTGLVGEMGK